MSLLAPSSFLRRILLLDGATSGALGLLMALEAAPLHEFLGLPAALLREAGLGLVPFGIALAYLSRRATLPRAGVLAVIATNAAWVLASFLLLLVPGIAPNGLGYAVVIGQAGAVAHGIARALQKLNPEYRAALKKAGHLTRDPREKERKKPGQPGARKRFQFSKR